MKSVEVRTSILDFLRRELVGPDPQPEHASLNDGEEILRPQDPPRLRYSAGVLFPLKDPVPLAENASDEEVLPAESGPPEGDEPEDVSPAGGAPTDAEAANDPEINRANEFLPSAMGVSALIRLPKALRITVRCGTYSKRISPGLGRQDREGKWQPHYWRKQVADTLIVDCEQFKHRAPAVAAPKLWVNTGLEHLKLELHAFSRPFPGAEDKDRDRIVTFTLINRTEGVSRSKDDNCAFQCEFSVEDSDGGACFLAYPEAQTSDGDAEAEALQLLHRDRRTFAVGHGCAATWSPPQENAAHRIATDVLPSFEVKPIVPTAIVGLQLSMRDMSKDAQWPTTLRTCESLAAGYRKWIDEQEVLLSAETLPETQRAAAKRHLKECRRCLTRLEEGIALLASDEIVAQAFRWMNLAMLQQQLHYDLATKLRREWDVTSSGVRTRTPFQRPDYDMPPPNKGLWRPFQLAFVLMNLTAVSDPSDPWRDTVDLIWFPTGGGKTEAYLGLSAFTILHRRLTDPRNAGTTVLMRYTLRLLTTQQYQRAASLICACELLRQAHPARLGVERITIGLWVGNTVSPNRHDEARRALKKLLNEGKPNPFVMLTCPWCAAEMGPVKFRDAYKAPGYRQEHGAVIFQCADADCDFSRSPGLPLLVADEAIYDEPPTMLIGTVDKFAMLPWIPESRSLFGPRKGPPSPPDLIIQDELHLISGALGSMVGLYETVVDALCRRETGSGPCGAKIVASTATICRAEDQVNALYGRDLFLFPPQGLIAGESFFARQDQAADGRVYVGVFATAVSSHVTAQIRTVASLLQAVKAVNVTDPAALDPYWTLMTYFNSLRELGHAATLIRADIREHLNAVWDRRGIRRPAAGESDRRRFINRDLELTSRIQSSEVTNVLQQLFERYRTGTDEDGRSLNRAVDICLATNMIQVGLDVPRLGLMAVVGQPKTSSEYIQATSRVGREADSPGLVVTIYNAAKPRDRSHYEHFRSYHQSLYRWVEPTSVTPFALPVRERALHAQIVILARFLGTQQTATPRPPPDDALVELIRDVLLTRVKRSDATELNSTDVMIREIVAAWRRLTPGLYGSLGPPPDETPLMYQMGTQPRLAWANRALATPTSMRNVDAGCDASVVASYPTP